MSQYTQWRINKYGGIIFFLFAVVIIYNEMITDPMIFIATILMAIVSLFKAIEGFIKTRDKIEIAEYQKEKQISSRIKEILTAENKKEKKF